MENLFIKKNSNYKNISKFAGSTMISRILGYFRDMVIANFFGAGFYADIFYVAYRVPNLFRRLLGEGALISAFIPIYTDYLSHKSEEEQKKFLGSVLSALAIALCAITILGIIFTPFILKIITPGFINQPEKFRLAVLLSRIMFPFFIAIGFSALFMGILCVHSIFIYSALSSCFLSISELLIMFSIVPFVAQKVAIIWLSIAVVIGGIWQALFQLIPIIKQKIKMTFCLDFKNDGLKKILILMIPAIIGSSTDQVSAFVDVIFASWLREGSISALYYSNHLMLLPLSLFGVAVSVVALPNLSKSASFENFKELKKMLRDNINIMIYFIIPSTVGLIVLANPIVKLLFERGKFDTLATAMTSSTLQFYCLGLFSYACVKIISTAFYSLKDTKTPVKIAAFCVVTNVIANFILMKPLKVGGLALATAISSTINLLLLLYSLRKRIGKLGFFKKQRISNFVKVFISSIFMGIICSVSYKFFIWNKFLAFIIPIFLGIFFYLSLTYILKVNEIKFILNRIKAKISKK
ncbi:MAG: murein biosynthesis integral membrane protein MurJ [Elusimicrobiota bacterium]|nr:murein biosynthesis integral membrane protein MurJ [Elusimicrobiota bacterium]